MAPPNRPIPPPEKAEAPDLTKLAPPVTGPAAEAMVQALRDLFRRSPTKPLRVGRGTSPTGQVLYYEIERHKVLELLGGQP